MSALTKPKALKAYRKLILIRLAEEKIRQEYHKDEMKTPVHLGIGAEAIAVGVCLAAPEGTKYFGTYRSHNAFLALSEDTDAFFGEMFGRASGPGKGKAGSMHMACPEHGLMLSSAIVGTPIPIAVGAAFAHRYRKSDDVAVGFFGDGATDEGVFWESVNFAALKKLRALLVCEDNDLAIHAKGAQRRGYKSLPEIVKGFDCHVETGDGADLVEVYGKARKLLDAMARDPKPGFLHLPYLRFLEHVGVNEDFEAGYREKPAADELERLDPVSRFEAALLRMGCAPPELDAIKRTAQEKIDKSVDAARKSPLPGPEELYRDVFA